VVWEKLKVRGRIGEIKGGGTLLLIKHRRKAKPSKKKIKSGNRGHRIGSGMLLFTGGKGVLKGRLKIGSVKYQDEEGWGTERLILNQGRENRRSYIPYLGDQGKIERSETTQRSKENKRGGVYFPLYTVEYSKG